MVIKYYLPLAALSVLGLTNIVSAASRNTANEGHPSSAYQRGDQRGNRDPIDPVCLPPEPPAACYPDDCEPCVRCLGPENYGVNAPVCPHSCDGDWVFTVAGFYWNAHQDGMEFALTNQVVNPDASDVPLSDGAALASILQLNNLVDASYETPNFKWDFGFKLGFAYCSPCDGWDIGVLWTRYHGRARDNIDADSEDNTTLLPLWSAFAPAQGSVLYATQGSDRWKLKLNLVDIELGRQFWTSKYLSIRPFIGVRYASIDQNFYIQYRGGSWAERTEIPLQEAFNDNVYLENDFKGFGVRSGLNSEWNFGCGWALYGNLAASIIYGRFEVEHKEFIRQASGQHLKFPVLDTDYSFRACRGMLDLALGIQWSTMFCDCQYGFTAMFGWEGHLFFDQNQMWRVNRVGALSNVVSSPLPNNQGDNVLQQRRGTLDTQGWTLTFKFEF